MTPKVYQVFEQICQSAAIRGAVLEVGAVRGSDGLLQMPCLRSASRRIGINCDRDQICTTPDYTIVEGNSNQMACFADGEFEAVICNATLEHDPYFWKTIAEIHRITAAGGLILIGVPGFSGMGPATFVRRNFIATALLRVWARLTRSDVLLAGTVTLGEHNFPGDYYRFSEQAMREVFLAGLTNITLRSVMNPPRLIGWGRKP